MTETNKALFAFRDLANQVHELELRREERLKAQHGRFNVFTTLLQAHDEVRLHTRFLHELLNPTGTHDCGALFLDLFFETLAKHPPLSHDGVPTQPDLDSKSSSAWTVQKETRTAQGQLDLLLESDTTILAIENKILAGEQPDQLARYIKHCTSQSNKKGLVIFLTLDGKAAWTHDNKHYLRISYREHIAAWLERCLEATYNAIPINQTLIQYRRLVLKITGQAMEQADLEKVKSFIRSNPQIISQMSAVTAGIAALRVEALNRFADELIKKLSPEFEVRVRPDVKESFGVDPFGGLIIRHRGSDITESHTFEIWIEHINKWKALVIGIEASWRKPSLSDAETVLLQRLGERMHQHCQEHGIHHSSNTQSWGGTHWPIGWHDLIQGFLLDDQALAEMLNPDSLSKQVESTANAVREYMSLLHKSYTETTQSNTPPNLPER